MPETDNSPLEGVAPPGPVNETSLRRANLDDGFFEADEGMGQPSQKLFDEWGTGRNGHQHFASSLASSRPGAKAQRRIPSQYNKYQRWLPLVLGLVGLLFILTCLGIGAVTALNLLPLQSSLSSPETALDGFYSALRTGNYQSAYSQLSSHYQQQVGYETGFENKWGFLQGDPIQSYQISGLQTQSQSASATVQVVRGMQGVTPENQIHKVALIVEGSDWKIDNITIMPPSS
jgi:hypothetical protein